MTYEDQAKLIPWNSFGRETVASRAARSLVPVGTLPFDAKPFSPEGVPAVGSLDPDFEKYIMNIRGTAIQAGKGKLVTCAHVVAVLPPGPRKPYILAKISRPGYVAYIPYPFQMSLNYVDPRTMKPNPDVDLAVIVVGAKSTDALPYEVTPVSWGDSGSVGIGDSVLVGGFPYGTEMFRFTSNRGIVQPTFYSGIVSAVLPAMNDTQTRIFQISVASAGGMSGGGVFHPESGELLAMITSCVHAKTSPDGDDFNVPLPISYALPSEVIAPFADAITFTTKGASSTPADLAPK